MALVPLNHEQAQGPIGGRNRERDHARGLEQKGREEEELSSSVRPRELNAYDTRVRGWDPVKVVVSRSLGEMLMRDIAKAKLQSKDLGGNRRVWNPIHSMRPEIKTCTSLEAPSELNSFWVSWSKTAELALALGTGTAI